MDTIPFENLEEKLMKYREEDRNNSQILTTEDFSHYCNQRRLFYIQLGREIGKEREKLFYEILEPLKIKPIVKRDFKTIIGGLSIGIIGGPFSLLAVSGYHGFKKLFKKESKHGDQYTLLSLAIPLIGLGYAIREIKNPNPIGYKITNKDKLNPNNISENSLGISLTKSNNLTFNPDYIKQENNYPIELHFSNNRSFSLNNGFNEVNSTEDRKKSVLYFEANPELIEKFEMYRKISKAYVETYNQLESFDKTTYPRLINNPNNKWIKATAL